MTAQDFLNEMIGDLKIFIDNRNESMLSVEELFKSKDLKDENELVKLIADKKLTSDEIDSYYKTSQLVADTATQCRKICDFIHFNKITGVELNVDEFYAVNGVGFFIQEYIPYKTIFGVTPENKTKELNAEEYKESKSKFIKFISNNTFMNYTDEARDGNSTQGV